MGSDCISSWSLLIFLFNYLSQNLSVASLGRGKAALGFGADRIKTVVTVATKSSH